MMENQRLVPHRSKWNLFLLHILLPRRRLHTQQRFSLENKLWRKLDGLVYKLTLESFVG